MKHALLLAAALLLPACSSPQASFPTGPWWHHPSLPAEPPCAVAMEYEPSTRSFRRALHQACRECATVEFRHAHFQRRIERRHLEGALAAILEQDAWYARRAPEGYAFKAGHCPSIRFLDARGQELFALRYYPACEGFVYDGTRYRSLWELLNSWAPPTTFTGPAPLEAYHPLNAQMAERLSQALAQCHAVTLVHERECRPGEFEEARSTLRGAQLNAILARLRAVPQWFEADYGNAHINPGMPRSLHFHVADGRLLATYSGLGLPHCVGKQGERLSLTDFFPFPQQP